MGAGRIQKKISSNTRVPRKYGFVGYPRDCTSESTADMLFYYVISFSSRLLIIMEKEH
jgi:hypothetical protein